MSRYLKRRAAPWVSMAVLAGGFVSALLLIFIYKVQSDFQSASTGLEAQYLGLSR